MNKEFKKVFFWPLIIFSIALFLISCLITMSDGQGALIFIFTLPLIGGGLFLAHFVGKSLNRETRRFLNLRMIPKAIGLFISFIMLGAFLPGLNAFTEAFMNALSSSFVFATGKTPYAFFKERNSFANVLSRELESKDVSVVSFDKLPVTFAWDRVCLFGPYTNNAKAKSILKIEWDIEDASEVHFSDSINSLVFLSQGKVNSVADLKRGIADFSKLDFCIDRAEAQFQVKSDESGRKVLEYKTK